MPCPSTIYCISNTGVPLYNDTYEDTLTNYNGVQYYTGQTNGLFIYYSSGDTQWCLSNTLGGTCYLSGKSPCSTTCPDLCDEFFNSGICPTPTPSPTNNCSSLDFSVLFDCDLPLTPTVTPTMTVTPTVTVTPTSSSICPPPFIDATIFSLSPTPTPTPTITPSPSVVLERDCTFSGAVTYDMINDDIVCPFSYEFQDCFDQGKKYYTFDTLETPSGEGITQFMVFNATVNGTNKCIHYVGFNNQISGIDSITLLTGPYGFSNRGECLICEVINTPTPTQTPTNTPTPSITPSITPTKTLTPTPTPTPTKTLTPTPSSPPNVIPCNSNTSSGGVGISDYNILLDNPNGGVVIIDFNAIGVPDKLEIIHAVPIIPSNPSAGYNYVKKATSSMSATGNYTPFNNTYGTRPTNTVPTAAQTNSFNQFIGTDKGSIPTRMTQFYTDTGYSSPSYPLTSGRQQRVWWKYSATDYTNSTLVNIRVTGPSGTSWGFTRVCIVPSSINLGVANCRIQGSCNDNSTCGVRIPVTVSNAPVGYYVLMTVLSSTNATATYFGGNVTYTETTSVGSSVTIKLDLYNTFGGLLLDSTTQTITRQPSWSSLPNC